MIREPYIYWAKLYTEQLKEPEDYSLLSKAIGIHILNFISIPAPDKYHNIFHIVEKDNGCKYFKDLELHTIELKKFADAVGNELSGLIAKIKTSLDIWATFLTKYNLLDKDNLPQSLKEVGLKKAISVLEVMNFIQAERENYEDHLQWLRIQTNTIKKYKQDGIEEGIQIGEAKLIKLMRDNGHSVKEIAKLTKLLVAKINELLEYNELFN